MNMTALAIPTSPVSGQARPTGPILPDVLRSEWTKLRSVRSTYWSLLVAAVATVGLSALLCTIYINRFDQISAADKATFNPTSFSLSGLFLAQLAIAVLGVLIITGEFSSGMIRSTFAAVPQRRTVLAAKAVVFTAVALIVGIVSCLAAFYVGQAILSSKHLSAHIGDPGVLRSVIGAGAYLGVLGLLSLGIGTLIRHSAGAIAAVFGLIFVLPGIVGALPSSWSNAISPYLPSEAGQAIFRAARDNTRALSPWTGFGVFCLYALVVMALAGFSLTRRDA
jgi:ABC-2 type transport system permease protein